MRTKGWVIVLASLLFTSCAEALIEDHIAGSWELSAYLRNDVDETSEMKISGYEETYILDGTYSRVYIDGKQQAVDETGKFDINEDDMSIHISDVSSIADFSDQHSTLSYSVIDVKTIDETEFVYTFENGGDKHEFRFLKKE